MVTGDEDFPRATHPKLWRPTARRPPRILLLVGALLLAPLASLARADNLATCLDGRYPALCKRQLLSPDELRRAQEAERRANLQQCLDGRYPNLCRHGDLAPDEAQRVARAEHDAALQTCLDGRYPNLCRRSLLTPEESKRVEKAEHDAALQTCLDGRYPNLCRRQLLTSDELKRVEAAERTANLANCLDGRYPSRCRRHLLTADEAARVSQAEQRAALNKPKLAASAPDSGSAPRYRAPARVARGGYAGSCESGHWIQDVIDGGRLIRLEDGSLWEVDAVDQVDSSLWLPVSNIVICDDKLINTDDNESVSARQLH